MDLTTAEVARKHGQSTQDFNWPNLEAAFKEYGAQEAKAYASWLGNQVFAGRTAHKLWLDYEAEVLSQVPLTTAPAALTAQPLSKTVGAGPEAALMNDAERKYLQEVYECLPVSMADFLHDFHRRLALAAPSPSVGLLGEGEAGWLTPAVKAIASQEVEREIGYRPDTPAHSHTVSLWLSAYQQGRQAALSAPATPAVGEAGGAGELGFVRGLLAQAADALAGSYDVTEWPADGSTSSDAALRVIRAYLDGLAAPSPLDSQQAGKEGQNG